MFFSVKTQQEAELVHSFNGAQYNGKPLNVQIKTRATDGGAGRKSSPAEVARVLPQFLAANYNAELRLLNLGAVASRTTAFRADWNNPMFVRTLLKTIQDTVPQVLTINFEGNRIRNLSGFSGMSQVLPSVENLSFVDNEISDLKELENLSKTKLVHVMFQGNPIVSDPRYEAEVRMHLTSLKMLDSKSIAPLISFDVDASAVAATTTVVPPSRESFFEGPAQRQWVFDFLTKFFTCYDGNRNELLRAYIDESIFTISASQYFAHSSDSGRGGRGGRGGKFGQGGEHHHYDPALGNYIKYSRNLAKIRDREQIRSRVVSGRVSIVHTMTQLPASRHSKDDMVVDALTLPGIGQAAQMILVTLHGHFWESQTFGSVDGSNVAFDRSLILALAPPGSEAAAAGWPAIVVNDQLHIRNFIAPSTKPQSGPSSSSSGGSGNIENQLIEQLMNATRLKAFAARQCLESASWNYDSAMAQFWSAQQQGRISPNMLQ